jgi:hypothetical protein
MTVIYKINGSEVTQSEFVKDSRGVGNIRKPYESSQTIVSEAAAVHPKDREAAEEHARKHGFPINFDHHGRPSFNSHRQQRAYLKTIGLHNKDGIG